MRKCLLALVFLLPVSLLASFSTTPTPDKAVVSMPAGQQIKNVGGRDGAGLCVFTSAEVAGRYQNIAALNGFQKYMTRQLGGGYPDKFEKMLAAYCKQQGVPVPRFVQSVGGDVAFLESAVKTKRAVCVTYGGRDDFYRGPIAHMVVLAHLDDTSAAIIDNNRVGVYVWMSRAEFLSRWKDSVNMGWAIVFLDPPPPPGPVKASDPERNKRLPLRGGNEPFENHGIIGPALPIENHGIILTSAGELIPDDSGKLHITFVSGSATDRANARAALKPAAARHHVQVYDSADWAVRDRVLRVGVTVRRPDGSDVYYGTDITGAVDAADGKVDPVPAPIIPPTPVPQPPIPSPVCPCGPKCKCQMAEPAVPTGTLASWLGIVSSLLLIVARNPNGGS